MARLVFSDEDREALRRERFEHPHPRVQKRMDVLWYICLGETYARAAELGGVSPATVDRYVAIYREGGIEGLKQFDWKGMAPSELVAHKVTLEEMFRQDPPHTTAEACRRIEEATGVKRGLTQVRRFLKKHWA